MQRNKQKQEQSELLSTLPIEVLIHIFKYVDDKDLINIKLLSSPFYNIISEYFSETLYGKSLNFERWQAKQISSIEQRINLFQSKNTATMFYNPASRNNKVWQVSKFMAEIVTPLFMYALLTYVLYIKTIEKKITPNTTLALFFVLNIAAIGYFMAIKSQGVEDNTRHQTKPVNRDHVIELKNILSQSKPFLLEAAISEILAQDMNAAMVIPIQGFDLLARMEQQGIFFTRINEMLKQLNSQLQSLKTMANNLNTHLKTSRFSRKMYLDLNSLPSSELRQYAKRVLYFWEHSYNKKMLEPVQLEARGAFQEDKKNM